jgi:hypothetical protein
MSREAFYNDRLARYLAEGMAMEAARARASAVTCSHFVESEMSDRDHAWDQHSPESNRWHE